MIYKDKRELDKAVFYCEKSLQINIKCAGNAANQNLYVATNYNNLGTIYYAKGDIDKAAFYFEKSL